jgi:hypothetical protein
MEIVPWRLHQPQWRAALPGLDWITALRAEQIQALAVEGGPLQRSLFDQSRLIG